MIRVWYMGIFDRPFNSRDNWGLNFVELTLPSHTLLQLKVAYNMFRILVIGILIQQKSTIARDPFRTHLHRAGPAKSQNSHAFWGAGAHDKNIFRLR